MFGFLNVRKPAGPTSHDIVARVRTLLPPKTKVGHAGTLDPFAEGVLVVCVGPATRLAEYVGRQPKRYVATVTLGASSTTDDAEGDITAAPHAVAPEESKVRDALGRFLGEIEQVPPAHSAVHVGGRRAYDLARAGQDVPLSARPVTVGAIDVLSYAYPLLRLDVRCGRGTYIRALARDIGCALGVGGYCSKLTRTEVGRFRLDQAVGPDELDLAKHLIAPVEAIGLATLVASEADAAAISRGKAFRPSSAAALGEKEIAVLDGAGKLLAVAVPDAPRGLLRPVKVFNAS